MPATGETVGAGPKIGSFFHAFPRWADRRRRSSVTTRTAGNRISSATVAAAIAAQARRPKPASDGTLLTVTAANPTPRTSPPSTTGFPVSTIARRIALEIETPSRRFLASAAMT